MFRCRSALFCSFWAFAVTLLFLPCSVRAAGPDVVADRFIMLDADHDDSVSWDEFHAVNPDIARRGFDSIDTDKKGSLSLEEWRTFSANHGMGVPTSSSHTTMPPRPVMPPMMSSPGEPGTFSPSIPVSPKDGVASPRVPQSGIAPAAPSVPSPRSGGKTGTMPLIMPPVEAGNITTPQAPGTPAVPLVMPPSSMKGIGDVTMSKGGETHQEGN